MGLPPKMMIFVDFWSARVAPANCIIEIFYKVVEGLIDMQRFVFAAKTMDKSTFLARYHRVKVQIYVILMVLTLQSSWNVQQDFVRPSGDSCGDPQVCFLASSDSFCPSTPAL